VELDRIITVSIQVHGLNWYHHLLRLDDFVEQKWK
jgi:hypothetical protein